MLSQPQPKGIPHTIAGKRGRSYSTNQRSDEVISGSKFRMTRLIMSLYFLLYKLHVSVLILGFISSNKFFIGQTELWCCKVQLRWLSADCGSSLENSGLYISLHAGFLSPQLSSDFFLLMWVQSIFLCSRIQTAQSGRLPTHSEMMLSFVPLQ